MIIRTLHHHHHPIPHKMISKLMDESQSLLESQPETGPVATSWNSNCIPKCFITSVSIMVLLGGLLLLVVGLLSSLFVVSEPELYIGNFHIPALNVASKDPETINNATTITFDLSFENLNPKQLLIFYDAIDVNLYYYGSSSSSLPIGNTCIPEFDQGNTWPTLRVETVKTYGVPWEAARTEISNGREAVFRVDLYTKYRSSNQVWFGKWYDLRIGANVSVNDHGFKSVKQRLKLT